MATPIFRYPLDPTGVNPDNLVVREPHSLIPKSNIQDVRVVCPLYGPFYADSIVILDAANGQALDKDTDYKITDLLSNPTLEFAKEIGQFIVITNGTVSNEIQVSYQVLGGNYQNDATAVQNVFETFLNDTRPVDWSNISGKPATYPPSLHLHLLQDIINFGPLVVAIDSLRQAKLLNNTPMFEALIDWIKTKKVVWNDIADKPTTLNGYGITNAVTLDTVQNVTGIKNFSLISVGRGSTAISTDDNSSSYIATVGQLSRTEARLVPKTRRISVGNGLTGGGTLDSDVTIGFAPPLTVDGTSKNQVTSLGHSHEFDPALLSPKYKWKDVTSLRANGGTYTNTSSHVMYVSVRMVNAGYQNGVSIWVDGITIFSQAINPDGRGYTNGVVPVPAGSTYGASAGSGIAAWLEMTAP